METLICTVCGKEYEDDPTAPGRRPRVTCGAPECRRARKHRKTQESNRRTHNTECPPDKHGTGVGYTLYRCGCPECSRWAREYQRERRRKQRADQQ
jgi:hypothetical protein